MLTAVLVPALVGVCVAKSREERPLNDAQQARVHFDLGRASYLQKQFQAAIGELQQAVAKDETHPEYRYQLAQVYFAMGDWKSAEDSARLVLEQDASFWDALLLRGSALGEMGRFDEAMNLFQSLAANPAFTYRERDWVNIGGLYEKLESHEKAIEAYRKALDAKTNYPPAHYGLAQALEKSNRLPDALEHYRLASETSYKDSPQFQYRYGVACFRLATELEKRQRDSNDGQLAEEVRRWKALAAEKLQAVVQKAPGTTDAEQAEGLLKLIR